MIKVAQPNTSGFRLLQAMEQKGYTVTSLARETNITKQTIQRLLRDDGKGNLYTWGTIADVLDVSIDWLYRGDERD